MNENFIANMKSNLQPMMDVAEINRKTFEKLTTLQSNCMTDCLNAGIEQFKALSKTQEPQAATELQVQFFKHIEAKLTNTAEQEVAAFNEAQKAITEVMEEGYTRMTDMSFFKEVSAVLAPRQEEVEKTPVKKAATKKVS